MTIKYIQRRGRLHRSSLCFLCYLLFTNLLVSLPAMPTRGDIVFYRLPTRSAAMVILEGTTTVNPGGSVTFSHPKFGRIYFDLESVEIKKAPPLPAQFDCQLNRAGKDPERRMEVAHWAL